mgnify:CR=1 FL=1
MSLRMPSGNSFRQSKVNHKNAGFYCFYYIFSICVIDNFNIFAYTLLNRQYGTQTFEIFRDGGKDLELFVALTEEGEELFPLAIQTLSTAEDCHNKMRDLKGTLTGTLRYAPHLHSRRC